MKSLVDLINEALTKNDISESKLINNVKKYITNSRKLIIFLSNHTSFPITKQDRHGKDYSDKEFEKRFNYAIENIIDDMQVSYKNGKNFKQLTEDELRKMFEKPVDFKKIDVHFDDDNDSCYIEFDLKGLFNKPVYIIFNGSVKQFLEEGDISDLEDANYHYNGLDD